MRTLQSSMVFILISTVLLFISTPGLAENDSKTSNSIPLLSTFLEKDSAVLADQSAQSGQKAKSIAARASRIAQVTINADAIDAAKIAEGDSVLIDLFDNTSLKATIERVSVSNNVITIRGKINDSNSGHIFTTVYENKVLTVIELPAKGYQYKIVFDNTLKTHLIYKTKLSELDRVEGAPSLIPPTRSNDSSSLYEANAVIAAAEGETTVDVMIVYTPIAADWASTYATNIHNVISLAMAKAQLTLENSNTLMKMRLVYAGQVDYTESSTGATNLNKITDGDVDNVHALRNQYSADLVSLFARINDYAGIAWLQSEKTGWPDYGYSVVDVQYAYTGFTFIHELGHNMGADHYKYQNSAPGPTDWWDWPENTWSAGWLWDGNDLGRYCSVMTYHYAEYLPDNKACTQVAHFSNPDINYQGVATGDSADGDNARTLREMRNVLAAYRTAPDWCRADDDCDEGMCITNICVECDNDTDCDDGDFCLNNSCVDCLSTSDCDDDSLYCTGAPICANNTCEFEPDHCGDDTPFCDEANKRCVECLDNSTCTDDLFCTGFETCEDGVCTAGIDPCTGNTPFCDETFDLCVECFESSECADDSLYCTGAPLCMDGVCGFEPDHCEGDTPFCDETNTRCVECLEDTACEDTLFCTGAPMCTDGVCDYEADPCDGDTPTCDEANDQCVECLEDIHCDTFFSCESNECIPFPIASPVTTVMLKGPGLLDVIFYPNMRDIAWIQLTGTTGDSSLTITSKLKGFDINLAELNIDGSLKAIKGKNVVLTGALTATGGIGKLQIARTESESSINAPWIGKLSITENFNGDMTLTGAGSPPKGLTLGKASVKGWLWNSLWFIEGNVGSVKVGLWSAGSILAVGVDPGIDGKFFTADDIATGGSLDKIQYKTNETDNNGEAFGIIANTFLKLKLPLPLNEDDFRIWEVR